MKNYQIAIDGPGGSGKSTIAKIIAEKLSFTYVNTGAMYRCYALAIIDKKVNSENENDVILQLLKNDVSIDGDKYYLNGVEVTKRILDNDVANIASKIGTIAEVRKKCVTDLQKISKNISVIMEGRDIGSVVLPNATLKIFLTADIKLRAKRRWLQINKKIPLEEIEETLKNRDYQDSNRKIAPLIQTEDAIKIYDGGLTPEEVANKIIKLFMGKINE